MCGLFSAPFLLVFLGTNYLRLMISTAPKQQLKEETKLKTVNHCVMKWASINQQKNYWCLTCFWTGWLFRMNHGDHFELLNARTDATRPRNSVAATWLLNSRTVATICSVSILSHSTLCLRWQPMGGDGGWRGSSHVQWLFSSQTPIWNCFPTWSSKINKDIQSKGSKCSK